MDKPSVIVKLHGSPLITGTRYISEQLRCSLCNARYKAQLPPEIKNQPKYDATCATAIAIARYSSGLPFIRIEKLQQSQGIPLPDATQWDLMQKLYADAFPVVDCLITSGANGNLVQYDDTPGCILENKFNKKATHTTAVISKCDDHVIYLYFTGTNHAGKNADRIFSQRNTQDPVIVMVDASPSNIPKEIDPELAARFILCFCLVHGRRKFHEIFQCFEQSCGFVLDIISQVYQHERHCKDTKLNPQERLIYHQQHSGPLMQGLYLWLNNQLFYELSQENSGLGQAISYMLRHFEPLTKFLRVAGAPLDNSWSERAIKIAIRHRRNSLFYKTSNGALVGDGLMSLIYTASQNGVNVFDYLTTLQRYNKQVAAQPIQWLPWNYQKTLQAITTLDVKNVA